MKSILDRALTILALVAALFLLGLLYWLFVCFCERDVGKPDDGIGLVGPEVHGESSVGFVDPKRTEGAPYPPVEPVVPDSFIPNASSRMQTTSISRRFRLGLNEE